MAVWLTRVATLYQRDMYCTCTTMILLLILLYYTICCTTNTLLLLYSDTIRVILIVCKVGRPRALYAAKQLDGAGECIALEVSCCSAMVSSWPIPYCVCRKSPFVGSSSHSGLSYSARVIFGARLILTSTTYNSNSGNGLACTARVGIQNRR